MKPLLLFACFLIAFFSASAQIQTDTEKIYVFAEEMPQFPGGQDSMFAYIAKNISYPPMAVHNSESGTVFTSFVVEQTGKIVKPEVIKGVTPLLDAEALRVISKMPAWKPGKQSGQPVAVKFTLPVRFQLKTELKTDSILINEKIEVSAEFPGGLDAMMQYLGSNIKYPAEAHKNGIQGRSVISFVVNTDGSLSDYKVVERLGYGTDEEAIRVLQSMPLWKPGKVNGKLVRVKHTLPVMFKLNRDFISLNEKVDEQPEFPGGFTAFLKFLGKNMRYPTEALSANVHGEVKVSFIVNENGSLSNYKIIKSLGYGTDQEAIRVLQKMPRWKPAIQNGKPVPVQCTLPFRF